MSRFGMLLAAHDERPGMPATIHVPTTAEMRSISTADLRLLLAQAFAVANAVVDRRRGHGRTMSEIHIQAAQSILRKASRDAMLSLQEALVEPRPGNGGDWSDFHNAPDEELTGPLRPVPPDPIPRT